MLDNRIERDTQDMYVKFVIHTNRDALYGLKL